MRRVATTAIALTSSALTLACTPRGPWYDVPIHEKYTVASDAPADCIAAAKRATYWCTGPSVLTDPSRSLNCNDAQWDYNRQCPR